MEDKPVQLEIARLRVDHKNPRIPVEAAGQHEALRAIAANQKEHLIVLADHIVTFRRLNPADLPIVMPSEDDPNFWTVLEGNRRLTALRAMENPDLFAGVLEAKHLKKIRALSAQYRQAPIEVAWCVVMKDREEAQPWIDLRHQGANGGAGIINWGPQEKARSRARSGKRVGVNTFFLNFLQDSGHLSASERQRVKSSTLQRMLENPKIREAIGFELHAGSVHFTRSEDAVVKAVMFIVRQLLSGDIDVKDVYTSRQREEYAAGLPSSLKARPHEVGPPRAPLGMSKPQQPAPSAQVPAAAQRPPAVRILPPRAKLIPSDCFLRVKDGRVKGIEIELRSLLLEEYPNAITVLFRVFLELSIDYYRSTTLKRGPDAVRDRLKDKLLDVVSDLESQGLLTKWQANPVRAACQKATFLVPSVVMMHEYIHNRHILPSPTDLRAEWDSLQPFILALWPR